MTRLYKEPLIHFLALGGTLFILFNLLGDDGELTSDDSQSQEGGASRVISKEIVVSSGRIESLIAQFSKTWQRPPTAQEQQGLIDEFVREEVMYRQALKLKLDRDDPMVKRRMRQKLEFFTEDILTLAKPTDEVLAAYLDAHPDPYRQDSKFTFKQVYLNTQDRAETIEADVSSLLAELRAAGASADIRETGDRLMLEQEYQATSQFEIGRIFGEQFAKGLPAVETASWQGPVRSGFGVHLVFISERIDGRLPPLSEIREAVERDWSRVNREESNEAIYDKWLAEYEVTIEEASAPKEDPEQ
jgi:hypothetical protein